MDRSQADQAEQADPADRHWPTRYRFGLATRRLTGESMGTRWSLACVTALSLRRLRRLVEAPLARCIAELSHWEPGSALSRFNRGPAGSWHPLPPELAAVLAVARRIGALSDGAFEPALGLQVAHWGFGPMASDPTRVDPWSTAGIGDGADPSGLVVDTGRQRLFQPGGVHLDLSGIGKGHAVDRVSESLLAAGVDRHLFELGGELRAQGLRADGRPWIVGISTPLEPGTVDAAAAPLLALRDCSVATSGDAWQRQTDGRRQWSHTIDPRSGRPIDDRLAAVTVVHRRCIEADGWATALLVLGPGRGWRLACEQGLAARFVIRGPAGADGVRPAEVLCTPALHPWLGA